MGEGILPHILTMLCKGCGRTGAYWVRTSYSKEGTFERCSNCSPHEATPKTGGTVERFLAYKSRNSLNPPVIPTLSQPAREHGRVLKKLEAKGKLTGKALLNHRRILRQMEREDALRERGLFDDGKTPLSQVADYDDVYLESDGGVRDRSGKRHGDFSWEVVDAPAKPPEIKEVVINENSPKPPKI